jgi:hypothetical protein
MHFSNSYSKESEEKHSYLKEIQRKEKTSLAAASSPDY